MTGWRLPGTKDQPDWIMIWGFTTWGGCTSTGEGLALNYASAMAYYQLAGRLPESDGMVPKGRGPG